MTLNLEFYINSTTRLPNGHNFAKQPSNTPAFKPSHPIEKIPNLNIPTKLGSNGWVPESSLLSNESTTEWISSTNKSNPIRLLSFLLSIPSTDHLTYLLSSRLSNVRGGFRYRCPCYCLQNSTLSKHGNYWLGDYQPFSLYLEKWPPEVAWQVLAIQSCNHLDQARNRILRAVSHGVDWQIDLCSHQTAQDAKN